MPFFLVIFLIVLKPSACPVKFTNPMQLIFLFFICFSTSSGSRLREFKLISEKKILDSQYLAAFAVETKLFGDVK